MSSVIRALEIYNSKPENLYFIILGKHYSYNMDRVFFEQLKLPNAKYNLEVGSGLHGEQTAKILIGVEKALLIEKPDVILVEGDTNTVLAGALAAAKLHIKVGHVEAGLRSYDCQMPEEINRILTDHCSDYLFAPTENAKKILSSEGITDDKILMTGNTIVDAIYQNLEIAKNNGNILNKLNIKTHDLPGNCYIGRKTLMTPYGFLNVEGLQTIISKYKLPIIYPIHPRSRKMMAKLNLESNRVTLIEPVDYLSFLGLEKNAKLILTIPVGSREGCVLAGVPSVTLRDNTERPETLEVGASMLSGAVRTKILEWSAIMLSKPNSWQNPFGDGKGRGKNCLNYNK